MAAAHLNGINQVNFFSSQRPRFEDANIEDEKKKQTYFLHPLLIPKASLLFLIDSLH